MSINTPRERGRYEISVANSDRVPVEARGMRGRVTSYGEKDALSGFLAINNRQFLFDGLWYLWEHREDEGYPVNIQYRGVAAPRRHKETKPRKEVLRKRPKQLAQPTGQSYFEFFR